MLDNDKTMQDLKRHAENKMGMTWEEIMKQADADTKKQKQIEDPIARAYKESSISPNKMFKEINNKLNK